MGLRVLGWFEVRLVGLPGIMLISGASKREEVSAWVESIRAKARAKRASHLELLSILADLLHDRVRGERELGARGCTSSRGSALSCTAETSGWSAQTKGATVSFGAIGTMVGPRRTGCHKAEAARGDLGDSAEQVSLDHCA